MIGEIVVEDLITVINIIPILKTEIEVEKEAETEIEKRTRTKIEKEIKIKKKTQRRMKNKIIIIYLKMMKKIIKIQILIQMTKIKKKGKF